MAIRPRPDLNLTSRASFQAYIVLERSAALFSTYMQTDLASALSQIRAFIANNIPGIGAVDVTGLPGRSMMEPGNAATAPAIAATRFLVVQIRVSQTVYGQLADRANTAAGLLRGVGRDVPVSAGGHWCPGIGGGIAFSTREAAERLIGVSPPTSSLPKGSLAKNNKALTGDQVNVVIFDSGLDGVERSMLGLSYGVTVNGPGHLAVVNQAPAPPRLGHAYLTAAHLRALAPAATVHDYAILPPSLSRAIIPSMQVKLTAMISEITQAYSLLDGQITAAKSKKGWVIINAWAVYRREWQLGEDIDSQDSFLGWLINSMTSRRPERVDFIFASGNCGQFSQDPRCHGPDKGEGLSVIGPAGYPFVLTVGAVRADGLWVGSSSQGPSTIGLPQNLPPVRHNKPDIAAPSQFFDLKEPGHQFSGTSTACAITGAVFAALREGWNSPNDDISAAMAAGARKTLGSGWNARIGHGILDIAGTKANL